MDGNKPKPKIPMKEIHEILSIEMQDFKYLVIAIEKEEISKENGNLYTFTNFTKEQTKEILYDIIKQLEEGTVVENNIIQDKK